MRKTPIVLSALLLTMGLTVTAAAREGTQVDAMLIDTTIFGIPAAEVPLGPPETNAPGVNWLSAGIWHVRGLPVGDTVVDLAEPETVLGTLSRSINFNWNLETGRNQAWCKFSMDLGELGVFEGTCRGSLVTGGINGHGPDGVLKGHYELHADGVPGVGPYLLSMTIK